jgi:hypothetical protein
MFGLFNKKKKRRSIEDWELLLLYNTLEKLPDEFKILKKQIESELFVSASIGYSSFNPDYIGFSYSEIISDFENRKEKDYQITNIKVHDIKNEKYLVYTIYVGAGVIAGYSLKGSNESVIDINSIDVSLHVKLYYDNVYYDKLKKILNAEEIKFINQSDVYEVPLNGTIYYHVKDLEDGDFIGIDSNKVIYKITHDPFEIIPLNETLEQLLRN